MERPPASGAAPALHRFDLAPPRRFLFPAVLLLLAEGPGYGYRLVKELQAFRFGPADRPSVYRTLAQLERDGLVETVTEHATSAQSRRLYRSTPAGERALRIWMGVIKEERDRLDAVLRRYAGSGGVDAALAGVEGGWGTVAGPPLSSVLPTGEPTHRAVPTMARAGSPAESVTRSGPYRARYQVVGDRSAVLVEARSTVGPLTFGAMGLSGVVETPVHGGRVIADDTTTGTVTIRTDSLRSGNELYDAELRRRIDARRFPSVTLALRGGEASGAADRVRIAGDVTIHGVTRRLEGTLVVAEPGAGVLSVAGEQVVDVRDFDIAVPTMLMLRIYPDVVVKLYVEAEEVAVDETEERGACSG